jgi:3-dehydrosphinganine reductase
MIFDYASETMYSEGIPKNLDVVWIRPVAISLVAVTQSIEIGVLACVSGAIIIIIIIIIIIMTATAAEEAFVPWFHPFTIIVLVFLTVITLALLFLLPSNHKKQKDRAHAVITGGSSGIGLALAHECVKQGFATITLIARDDVKLQAARAELLAVAKSGKTAVVTYSFDVSDAKACHEQAKIILQQGGSPTVLLNNAGTSSSASFADTDVDEFSRLVTINYLGCVYLTQALLPSMRGGGTVVFTSSMAGQVGVYGNTAYSASKFALRGYCEALQMETRRDDIRVVMAFPPDTDTPGYKLENETKPKETMAISEAGGLFTPEK